MKEDKNDHKPVVSSSKVIRMPIEKPVPEDKIKLTKLGDGYSLEVNHNESGVKDGVKFESQSFTSVSQRFGRNVKDVKGSYNKDGVYELNVDFE